MTIRERIRYTRTIYQLTQLEVAKGLGVCKQYITQIETNKKIASDERLEEILNLVYVLGENKKKGRLKDVLDDLKEQNDIEHER
ncbi:helix-turn-helix transcriptional regulator [Clostridium sp. BJN0001]|uniref:helix-turn-helix domain-containing protein n=1 Tax=Clostridium sp. BJN0001 TaxID=2930219 RepID=UPI001FD42461|nr:helix-turn-helix transcriptional regulator [Clostridium sp. BJN0001]